MNLRILIADDQHLIRHALRILLDAEPDLEVVGEAGNVQELLHLTRQLQPDLVLFDLTLCRGECADLLAEIRQRQPAAHTVILTMIESEEVIVQALRAGANGYLLKSIVPQELLNALRAAVGGSTPLHPRIASHLLHRLNRPPAKPDQHAQLTAREQEILHLVAQGCSNAEIARMLVIHPVHRTVARLPHPQKAQPGQPHPGRALSHSPPASRRLFLGGLCPLSGLSCSQCVCSTNQAT